MIYGLLFDVAAETLLTIAADPKHLGAQIGATLVLHTWGSALTHHPHVHGIVPGGGLSPDGERWVACRPGFFLPVRVLSRLFRRRFLEELAKAHHAGQLQFFGENAALAEAARFADWLAPLREQEWVVYAKRPFAGPAAVLAYLSRYTHRVAISNRRLVALDERGVSFRWKDYRAKGKTRYKTMTLSAAGVHAPLPVARSARRLSPHPSLWADRQCRAHETIWRGRASCCTSYPKRLQPQPPDEPAAIVQPIFVCRALWCADDSSSRPSRAGNPSVPHLHSEPQHDLQAPVAQTVRPLFIGQPR